MEEWQVQETLKEDSFGRVERLKGSQGGALLRRVACGARIPGSGIVARLLLRRERLALEELCGQVGTPSVVRDEAAERAPSASGRAPRARDVLLRTWLAGEPLHLASSLPEDYFDHLDTLVEALHARGVCHNDLHKEQNLLVGEDGFPFLIDFQLASVHRSQGRGFRMRCREDLRHVQKHRRRYTRDGRGPASAGVEHGRGHGARRGPLSLIWRRVGKPIYNVITRRLLRTRDGEARRPSSGPWPDWIPARGDRPGFRDSNRS